MQTPWTRDNEQILADINVTLHDEMVMPPDSTTWRARTADVKVTLHDVGKKCREIRKPEEPGWNNNPFRGTVQRQQ